MNSPNTIGTYALIMRITVSNLPKSIEWYINNLGLIKTGTIYENWAELEIPEVPNTTVGLKLVNPPQGTAGEVITFVVRDIYAAIERLRDGGVAVEAPRHLAGGVLLSFFYDPDGNRLALRQNPQNLVD